MIDFDRFHRETLAGRVATPDGAAAARDVRDAGSLAFRLPDGRAWRFRPDGERLAIERGDDADTVAVLEEDAWRDFVGEMATAAGLVYGGHVRFDAGAYADLERWEPALRALVGGRPIFDPVRDVVTPPPVFDPDTPDATLAAALHEAGFVLVKQVFARDEIARLVETMERRHAAARPGDGRSWWAKRDDGTNVVCRLIYLGLVEPTIAALSDDPRLRRFAGLGREPLVPVVDRADGASLVLKHARVTEGLSDLPWHRDCGLGGHPVVCPAIQVGIQLDAATAETGRLHFVPGSWRFSCHRPDLDRARTAAIDTEPGDCTIHLGDVMHAAPAPTRDGPGRRALYVSWMPERGMRVIPPGKGYNDRILARVGG